jgi:hypothetical protein
VDATGAQQPVFEQYVGQVQRSIADDVMSCQPQPDLREH